MHRLPGRLVAALLCSILSLSVFGPGLANASPASEPTSPIESSHASQLRPTAEDILAQRLTSRSELAQVNPSGMVVPGSDLAAPITQSLTQSQTQPPVTLSPSSGPPGTRVNVYWPGTGPVCILIYAGPAQALWDGTQVVAESNDRGTVCDPISLSFTVPANAAPGPHLVRVTGTTSQLSATFTVTGGAPLPPGGPVSLTVSPDRGNGATYVVGEPVSICFNVSRPAYVRAWVSLPDGQTRTLSEEAINGRACVSSSAGLPLGPRTIRAEVIEGGVVLATASSTYTVTQSVGVPLPPISSPPPPAPPAPPAPAPAPPSCPLPAAGDLWRATDGRVFAYLEGAFHWVPDLPTFEAWGFSWGNVRDVSPSCLVGMELSHPLPAVPAPAAPPQMEIPLPEQVMSPEEESEVTEGGVIEAESEFGAEPTEP